jgi:peptidoglycan hydrolase-like protein with peptidoglycan-binding domain
MSQLDYIVAECNKRASNSAPVPAPTPVPTPPPTPPVSVKPRLAKWLKRGSTGSNVVFLQSKLGLKQDGQFGPITDKAVRAFQKANGLKVDGIVGPITWARLP